MSVMVSTAPVTRPDASLSTEAFFTMSMTRPSLRTSLHFCLRRWPLSNIEQQWQVFSLRAFSHEEQLSTVQGLPTISARANPVISSKARFTDRMVPSGSTSMTPSWIVSTTSFQ